LTLIGLCLLFFGAMISLPNVVGFRQRLFLTLTVTCAALLFDWIAFVPGPREFHAGSSASHPGSPVNSTFGRVVFGVVAGLMDLFAVYAWRLSIRLLVTGSDAKKPTDASSKKLRRARCPGRVQVFSIALISARKNAAKVLRPRRPTARSTTSS